jgi:hypothetical protein
LEQVGVLKPGVYGTKVTNSDQYFHEGLSRPTEEELEKLSPFLEAIQDIDDDDWVD